jgi:hypothetical protein
MITHTMSFEVEGNSDLDAHTDLVADCLIDLEESHPQLLDSTVSTDLKAGTVEITVTVEADDYASAIDVAEACIRTGIHSAGGHTGAWESSIKTLGKRSELINA